MYDISITTIDGQKVIDFANNSKDFIEVVFTIDGKEVKEGRDFSPEIKGYAYPPKLHKPVKKMKDGSPLRFNPAGGEIVAYVYAGEGSYKEEDIIKPSFIRHQLVDKISFKRATNEPLKILKVQY